MTRIVLEVSQDKDLDLLLALLDRLNVTVVQKNPEKEQSIGPTEDQDYILRGLPFREGFDEFIRDFEESRKDRLLPGREN